MKLIISSSPSDNVNPPPAGLTDAIRTPEIVENVEVTSKAINSPDVKSAGLNNNVPFNEADP